MKRRIIISMVFGAITILSHQDLYAFENIKTHPALTEKAAAASTMNDYLVNYLWLWDD